ncbi:hypothetical protein OKW27_000027 [Paraburkholderia sp. 35.1]
MNASGTITMSMTELDRLKVVQAVCERRLKPGQAADRLALSVRQVERLVRRYEAAGPAGLVSARRGQPSNRELPVDVRARAMRWCANAMPISGRRSRARNCGNVTA